MRPAALRVIVEHIDLYYNSARRQDALIPPVGDLPATPEGYACAR